MIETIYQILEEINSYYYSYCIESNTIQRTKGNNNSSCIRDLISITNKLRDLNIEFIVTENKHIVLK